MKISNIFYSSLLGIALVIILIYGKAILLPFVLAVIVWFLIRIIKNFVRKIEIKSRCAPRWIQNIVAFIIIFAVFGLLAKMLSYNIKSMSESIGVYEENINKVVKNLNETYNINIEESLKEYVGNYEFSALISNVINSISELFGNVVMVLLYVVFLMLEESVIHLKLKALFKDPERYANVKNIISQLNNSINSYIALKTLVSLITGVLSYIVLLILGIDFAFFWAFLIFLLNYIPTIGSLVATIFPALLALLQYTEFGPALYVLVLIGSIQLVVGNFIEPKIMGHSLNVSSLVVILALAFWGSIWGIVGMILSIPITVIMIIVFAQFKGTKGIAILLSEKGRVE